MAYDIFSPTVTSQNQSTQPTGFTQETLPTDAGIYSPGVQSNPTVAQVTPMAPTSTPAPYRGTYGSFVSPDAAVVLDKYGPGAYEHVLQRGYPGQKLTSGEATRALAGFTPRQQTGGGLPSLEQLGQANFQFDPNKYLPGINQQAEQIFGPQKAQLDSLRQLNESKIEQTKIRTKEDFQSRMKQEIEAINARGAFFQGGALERQSGIARDEQRALTDIELQGQADAADFLSKIGAISADQANYIKDELYREKNSAFDQFTDRRDFLTNLVNESENRRQWQASYDMDMRQFQESIRQWEKEYKLKKKGAKGGGKYQFDYNVNKNYTGGINMNYNTANGGPLSAEGIVNGN